MNVGRRYTVRIHTHAVTRRRPRGAWFSVALVTLYIPGGGFGLLSYFDPVYAIPAVAFTSLALYLMAKDMRAGSRRP